MVSALSGHHCSLVDTFGFLLDGGSRDDRVQMLMLVEFTEGVRAAIGGGIQGGGGPRPGEVVRVWRCEGHFLRATCSL
jgi:hypothetical protein